jgi:outer membrane lipoprotein-sorting protein
MMVDEPGTEPPPNPSPDPPTPENSNGGSNNNDGDKTETVEPLSWTTMTALLLVAVTVIAGGYIAATSPGSAPNIDTPAPGGNAGNPDSAPAAPDADTLAADIQSPAVDSVTGELVATRDTAQRDTRVTTTVKAKPGVGSKQVVTTVQETSRVTDGSRIFDTGDETIVHEPDSTTKAYMSPDVSGSPLTSSMDLVFGPPLSKVLAESNKTVTDTATVAGRDVFVIEITVSDAEYPTTATVYADQETNYPLRYDLRTDLLNGPVNTQSVAFTSITYGANVTADEVTYSPPEPRSLEQIRESEDGGSPTNSAVYGGAGDSRVQAVDRSAGMFTVP